MLQLPVNNAAWRKASTDPASAREARAARSLREACCRKHDALFEKIDKIITAEGRLQ